MDSQRLTDTNLLFKHNAHSSYTHARLQRVCSSLLWTCVLSGKKKTVLWERPHDVLWVDEICQKHMILILAPSPVYLPLYLSLVLSSPRIAPLGRLRELETESFGYISMSAPLKGFQLPLLSSFSLVQIWPPTELDRDTPLLSVSFTHCQTKLRDRNNLVCPQPRHPRWKKTTKKKPSEISASCRCPVNSMAGSHISRSRVTWQHRRLSCQPPRLHHLQVNDFIFRQNRNGREKVDLMQLQLKKWQIRAKRTDVIF